MRRQWAKTELSLILEGAQAGLSWERILKKRERRHEVFAGFDPARAARFDRRRVEKLLADPGIVRNRLKVESAVANAKAKAYVWRFVGGRPIVNGWTALQDLPTRTAESDALSRDLLARVARFGGSTICYAFMQAVGMVNDHVAGCFRYREMR